MSIAVASFDELDAATAYAVWKLRQDVFVVEQDCPYPDLDGRDAEPGTRHVLLRLPVGGLLEGGLVEGGLVGYARILDDADAEVWRIGRVALAPVARGRSLAGPVMEAALAACPGRDVVLDAQAPLCGWYARFGFEVDGPEFHEDGIAHVPMRRSFTAWR